MINSASIPLPSAPVRGVGWVLSSDRSADYTSPPVIGDFTNQDEFANPFRKMAAGLLLASTFALTASTFHVGAMKNYWIPKKPQLSNWALGRASWEAGQTSVADAAIPLDEMHKYATLYEALEALAHLDEDDEHYIDVDVAGQGRGFLALLSLYGVSAPKIFPHGGDSLGFKWSNPEFSRYVSVEDGIVALRDFKPGAQITCSASFDLSAEHELAALMHLLGSKRRQAVSTT